MDGYYGYIRVSTAKQGDGVSLEAQQEAIQAYAERHSLNVTEWFEEKETAAKRGRPVFSQVMDKLHRGQAKGLIVHKIDRSARNFSDWAKIGDLIDNGVDVRFAHESLDMNSRGGRLTADIQAVIAADYVRNLREECLKGIEGRLKQGLFPFGAPLGYLDNGKGKPKTPDPERAPFVRQAFELYASQEHSTRSLLKELQRRGCHTKNGRLITKGCLERVLSNPFYYGMIYMRRTNRMYKGVHEPLISKALFDRVQALKADKQIKKRTLHNHTYRRLITCGGCGRSLCGELQKGHVYMRCQTKGCPTKTIRQDVIEAEIINALLATQLKPTDQARLERSLRHWLKKRTDQDDKRCIKLQLAKLSAREEQLTDALLDRLIDKETFQDRKMRLLEERTSLEAALRELSEVAVEQAFAEKFLELVKCPHLTYQLGDKHKRRRLVETLFSNRVLNGKNLSLTPQKWLQDKDWALGVLFGPPDRDSTRTREQILATLDVLEH